MLTKTYIMTNIFDQKYGKVAQYYYNWKKMFTI